MLVLGMVRVKLIFIDPAIRPTGGCLARDMNHCSASKRRNEKTKRGLD